MEIKTIIRNFLSEVGNREGRIKIMRILYELEKENLSEYKARKLTTSNYNLNDWMDDQGLPNKESLTKKLNEVNKEVLTSHEVIFEALDPVKCRAIGTWDMYLTEDRVYVVREVIGDCIIIIDDSGDLNPYLKDRFINLSKRNLKAS